MNWFEVARNIFAVIGIITLYCVLSGYLIWRTEKDDIQLVEVSSDEHSNVTKGQPC